MLLRKGNSLLVSILLILVLSNLSREAPSLDKFNQGAISHQTTQESNLSSRIQIQFQFQAFTNIYKQFDVKTETLNIIRPFEGLVIFTSPLLITTFFTLNKDLELRSLSAKNRIIQHLLPFHGFS